MMMMAWIWVTDDASYYSVVIGSRTEPKTRMWESFSILENQEPKRSLFCNGFAVEFPL